MFCFLSGLRDIIKDKDGNKLYRFEEELKEELVLGLEKEVEVVEKRVKQVREYCRVRGVERVE